MSYIYLTANACCRKKNKNTWGGGRRENAYILIQYCSVLLYTKHLHFSSTTWRYIYGLIEWLYIRVYIVWALCACMHEAVYSFTHVLFQKEIIVLIVIYVLSAIMERIERERESDGERRWKEWRIVQKRKKKTLLDDNWSVLFGMSASHKNFTLTYNIVSCLLAVKIWIIIFIIPFCLLLCRQQKIPNSTKIHITNLDFILLRLKYRQNVISLRFLIK